ncbi:MAG: septum formation initiator family protein [Candidatus Korobacteraceae bacterium]
MKARSGAIFRCFAIYSLYLSWFATAVSLELRLTAVVMRGLLDDAVTITVHIAGKWLYRMRRVLATLCIGLLAASIGYKVVFGANGMKIWESKRAEVQALQLELERKKAEHEELDRHVQALQRGDPSVIEKEAREQLGYVKPGEVVLFEQRSKTLPSPAPSVTDTSVQK